MALSIFDNALRALAEVETLTVAKDKSAVVKSFNDKVNVSFAELLNPIWRDKESLSVPLNNFTPLNSVTAEIRSISDRRATNS
jgi:hypothetical protein